MQIISHSKHANNMACTDRLLSGFGGGLLVSLGLFNRSRNGIFMSLAGAELLRRAITGRSYAYELLGIRTASLGQGAGTTSVPYELGIRVDESIVIDRPRDEVFRFWRNFENLPRFMSNLESVTNLGGNRSHWVAKAPGGRTAQWDAVIHNEVPGSLIAWRSLPGAQVDSAGSVWFRGIGEHSTQIRIELQYNPPAGAVGAVAASMFGYEPGQQIAQDLRQLKNLLERATEERGWDIVEEASRESFPASDSPAYL